MGYGIKRKPKNMGQAVRFFCLECMGGYDACGTEKGYMPFGLVSECPDHACQLYTYRFGKDPSRSEKAKARIAAARSDEAMVISPDVDPLESSRTRRKAAKGKSYVP